MQSSAFLGAIFFKKKKKKRYMMLYDELDDFSDIFTYIL